VRRLLATPLLLATSVPVDTEFSRCVLGDSCRLLGCRATVLYEGELGPEPTVPPRAAVDGSVRLQFIGCLSP